MIIFERVRQMTHVFFFYIKRVRWSIFLVRKCENSE